MQTKHSVILVITSSVLSALLTGLLLNSDGGTLKVSDSANQELLTRIQNLEKMLENYETGAAENSAIAAKSAADESLASVSKQSEPVPSSPPIATQLNEVPSEEDVRAEFIARQQPEFRRELLVSKGFSVDEANWILLTETETELANLRDQYAFLKARRARGATTSRRGRANNRIRDQLGDDYYERYLEANGQATKIPISTVLRGSPGENAGLKPGDRVTAYGGKRVFNIFELNDLTVDGTEGESVLIEVERNGEPMQLAIPRGPIGIRSN